MTDEQEDKIKKNLLWEYQQGVSTLEAFRAQFRDATDTYAGLAKLFREAPEDFIPDVTVMTEELQRLKVMAQEYKELLEKNEERRASLVKMHIL